MFFALAISSRLKITNTKKKVEVLLMNSLVICGSPRIDGNSTRISDFLYQSFCKNNIPVKAIKLPEVNIEMCQGCLLCEDESRCPLVDDMHIVLEHVKQADSIIIVTPVYFDNIPGIMKNFIDRTNIGTHLFEGKKLSVVTVGQADDISWKTVRNYFEILAEILKMEYIGGISFFARKKDELDIKSAGEQLLQLVLPK